MPARYKIFILFEEFTIPMHMGFRWYGEGNDAIKLSDIKQIPGVTSIVWALHHKMPGEIWTRSNLFHEIGDGSTALFYEKGMIQDDYNAMAKYILDFTEKYNMSFPGWEPERMAKLDQLFKDYADVDHEKLWANLKYFLEAIMPTCEECDVKMAIHMDDPPWDIFGLPRLLINAENIDRFLKMVDHPYNCLTLCSGSLNADPNNDVPSIVKKHVDRIAFAHIRNVKHFDNGDFSEASHRDCDGETQIVNIIKAYHEAGYEGYIRPDHGRHLWNEGPGTVRPGYGLYDRALGIMYMLGVWDTLDKLAGKVTVANSN